MGNKLLRKAFFFSILSITILLLALLLYTLATRKGISQTSAYTGHLKSTDSNLSISQIYEKDFDFLYTELMDNYVNIKYKEDVLGFDFTEKYFEYKKKLAEISTDKEFYLLCSAFVSELKDGHINFEQYHPNDQEYIGSPYPSDFRSLLVFRKIEDKYIIVSSKIAPSYIGGEIISINQIPVNDIVLDTIKYFYHGANDECAIGKLLLRDMFYNYFTLYYDEAPTELTYEISIDGEIKHLTLYPFETKPAENIYSTANNFGLEENELPIYRIENNIGYVRIDTFNSKRSDIVKAFDDAVQAFKQSKVRGVIIDIRNNGGGNESFRDILGYLTTDVIDISMFHYKDSERFNEIYYLRPLYDNLRHEDADLKPQPGYTKWWKWTIKPAKEQFLTTVPVVVLVNECIFSSADSFASACKNYNLATVIGNILPSSGFGLSTPIVLPSKKYYISYSFIETVKMDGSPLENVISYPDITVQQTIEDLKNGIDTQLEAAKTYINQQVD